MAEHADLYVNDAFGCAHRAHASTEGVTHHLKPCVAGLLMQKVHMPMPAATQLLSSVSQSKHCDGRFWQPTPAVMPCKYVRPANLALSHVAMDHAPAVHQHQKSLCQQELNYLEAMVKAPRRPFCAIVGGSKVSSKIDVLHALIASCDTLIIGYGMSAAAMSMQTMGGICGSIAAASARSLQVLHSRCEAYADGICLCRGMGPVSAKTSVWLAGHDQCSRN